MNNFLTNATAHWQSTVQSVLTTTFMVTGYLMLSSTIKPQTAAYMVTANGICKVLLGMYQTDAGRTPAILPGSNTPQLVASHEVPDDVNATPVLPKKD